MEGIGDQDGNGLAFLVVEDSPTQSLTLRHLLEKAGYQAIAAEDGAEALEVVERTRIDLVISDIVMPGMNGYQLCRRLKDDRTTWHIPVILLTSLADAEDVLLGLEAGADNLITKPHDEDYLVSCVRSTLLNRHLVERDSAQLGVEIYFRGGKRLINADCVQMLNILLSTYENAIRLNQKLPAAREEPTELNAVLEERVRERTASLEQQIAEREALEGQLCQSQKMEAVGRLAGGVAHDFNNMLMVIKGFTEVLLKQIEEADKRHRYVAEIQKAAEQAEGLTQQLLLFSRGRIIDLEPIDLGVMLTDISTLLERSVGADVRLEITCPSDIRTVLAERTRLTQVIVNLCLNARDAMPEGGEIHIKSSSLVVKEKEIAEPGNLPPGEYAALEVSDTGTGMDSEVLSHIFEPFYTTKEKGKGTGLGLSIVYGIVNQFGGLVTCTSAPGKGTSFRIYLPIGKEDHAKTHEWE